MPPKRGPGRPVVDTLTPSQQRVLEAIERYIEREGMSPTLRELAEDLEQGVANVYQQVQRLERNGYLGRAAGKSRSLTVLKSSRETSPAVLASIPLLGTVAAGLPLFAPENVMGELLVDESLVRGGRYFALTVVGESMVDAGISPGDLLIVRQQPLAEHREIVVALVNEEATVKRLYHREGQVQLLPENSLFRPIVIAPEDDFRIVGKVVATRQQANSHPG